MKARIAKRVFIRADADIIYRALTDAKELTQWFCDRAESQPYEGGRLLAVWRAGRTKRRGSALYARLSPGCAVELHWIDDGIGEAAGPASHVLRYEILPGRVQTEVVMTDDGDAFPDEETLEFLSEGWNGVLLELKQHCEQKQRAARSRAAGGVENLETQ